MATATRFADNTTTNPINRVRVYGFAPGLKYMPVRGLVAGIGEVPQGCLVLFKPRVEKYMGDDYKTSAMEKNAMEQAKAVYAKYVGGASGDTGFRILDMLTDLPYDKQTGEDEADRYFALVHPNHIGVCEMGLETNVGGEDRFDNSKRSDPCPTCRLQFLKSEALLEQIRNSDLDCDRLERLRQTLIQSYQAGWNFARQKVQDTEGEIQRAAAGQPGKPSYDESDFHFMAMIHKKNPITEQAELVTKQAEAQGKAQAKALAEAIREIAVPVAAPVAPAVDAEEIARLKAQNEALLKDNEAIKDMLADLIAERRKERRKKGAEEATDEE